MAVQLNQIRDQLRELFAPPQGRTTDPRTLGPSWIAGGTLARKGYDSKTYLNAVGLEPDLDATDLPVYLKKETEKRMSKMLPTGDSARQLAGPGAPHWPDQGDQPVFLEDPAIEALAENALSPSKLKGSATAQALTAMKSRKNLPRAEPSRTDLVSRGGAGLAILDPEAAREDSSLLAGTSGRPLDTVTRIPFKGGKYRQHREVQTDISELTEVRSLQQYVSSTRGELDSLRDLLARLKHDLIQENAHQIRSEKEAAENYVREMRVQNKKALEEALERQRLAEATKIQNVIALERARFEEERDEGMTLAIENLTAAREQAEAQLHESRLRIVALQHEMQQQVTLIKSLQIQVATMKSDMEQGGFDPMVKVLKGEMRGLEERLAEVSIQLKRRDEDIVMLESARKTLQGQLASALTDKAQVESRFRIKMKKGEEELNLKLAEAGRALVASQEETAKEKARADAIEQDLNRQIQVTDLMNQRYTEALKKLKTDNQILKTALHREERKWRQKMESLGMGGEVRSIIDAKHTGHSRGEGSVYSTSSRARPGFSRVMSTTSSQRDDTMSLSQYLAKGKGPGSKAGSVVSGYTRGGGGGAREKKRAGFAIQEEAEDDVDSPTSRSSSRRGSRHLGGDKPYGPGPAHIPSFLPGGLSRHTSGAPPIEEEDDSTSAFAPTARRRASISAPKGRVSMDSGRPGASEGDSSPGAGGGGIVARMGRMRRSITQAREGGVEITAQEEVEALLMETADALESYDDRPTAGAEDSGMGGLIITSQHLRNAAYDRMNEQDRRVIGGRIVLGRSPAAEALGVGRGGPAVAAARGAPNIAMFRDKMERMQNILETMHDYGRKLEEELQIHAPLRPLTHAEAAVGAMRSARGHARLDQMPAPLVALGALAHKKEQEQKMEDDQGIVAVAYNVTRPRPAPASHGQPRAKTETERLLEEIENDRGVDGTGATMKLPFTEARKRTAKLGYMVKSHLPSRGFVFDANPSALHMGSADPDETLLWKEGQAEAIENELLEGEADESEEPEDDGPEGGGEGQGQGEERRSRAQSKLEGRQSSVPSRSMSRDLGPNE